MTHLSVFSAWHDTPDTPNTPPLLATAADLAAMQPGFKRLRMEWVGRAIAAQACPVEMADGSIAVFCVPERHDTDVHASVCEVARLHQPHQAITSHLISGLLLLTLVRERLDGAHFKQGVRQAGHDRSDTSRAFRDIIAWAVRQGCSDIHLNINFDEANSQIHVHIDGHYLSPPHLRMPTERLLEIARVAWQEGYGGRESVFDPRTESQCRLYDVVDSVPYLLRWGQFVADKGPAITLRLLRLNETDTGQNLAQLGYLPSQIHMLERAMLSEGGAIVFGGVVGSGKSTSLAHLLALLPATRKIMSIEDPVERTIPNALQASIVRSFDQEDETARFRAKLMMLKRAAVSDALLGEVRDEQTGRAFLDIVESGTNLYTTLHVGSVTGIPARLSSRQVQVPIELLASPGILKLLVYQALLPKLCLHCALPVQQLTTGASDALLIQRDPAFWQAYLLRLQRLYQDISAIRIRNPNGCLHCRQKGLPALYGYAGRTAVAELFEPGNDPEALRAIRRQDAIALSKRYRYLSDTDPFSADMRGKSAMQCALYKMLHSQLDPRDIEPRFMAFETLESLIGGQASCAS